MNTPILTSIAVWPTTALVIAAAVCDQRTYRIPNVLVLPALALGLIFSAVTRGWAGLGQSLLGVLLATVICGFFCYAGGLGMGDLKLLAAVGAWVGPSQLVSALMMTALSGAVMALLWAAFRGFLREALINTAAMMFGSRYGLAAATSTVHKMPYAPAIAVGTICSFLGKLI